jgi:hypothetical protein
LEIGSNGKQHSHGVTLPVAAQHSAHEFAELFTFTSANANRHAADHIVDFPAAAESITAEAREHLPEDKFIFLETTT